MNPRGVRLLKILSGLLAVTTPAWAPEAPDRAFEEGARAANQQYLQQRQFDHDRRMLWEQAAITRGPSSDARLNNAVSECGNQVNLRAYAWDSPGGPRIEWWGAADRIVRAFKDCLSVRGYGGN
jgi:hypothetical protein